MIAQHLSGNQEHPTPKHVVELAKKVLGRINLDPASCAKANQVVRARRWIGRSRDGLAAGWGGTVFLNPPGGTFTPRRKSAKKGKKKKIKSADKTHKIRYRTDSRAVAWWRKLVDEYESGKVTEAIFIGFNLDILQASQGDRWRSPLDFPICIPEERLHFGGDQPTHGNVIVYLGRKPKTFARIFRRLGAVKI